MLLILLWKRQHFRRYSAARSWTVLSESFDRKTCSFLGKAFQVLLFRNSHTWEILSGVSLLNFLLQHSLLEQLQFLNSSASNPQFFTEASSSASVFIRWRFCSFFYHPPQWLSATFPADTFCITSVDSHPLRSCTSPFPVYTTSHRKCPPILPQ